MMTTDDYGKRLSAAFLKACGQTVLDGHWPRLWVPGGHPGRAEFVPDYTQPGHLETVIGMVRERWPDQTVTIRWRSEPLNNWQALISPDNQNDHGVAGNPSEALMLAARRAAEVEVPER